MQGGDKYTVENFTGEQKNAFMPHSFYAAPLLVLFSH